MEEQVRKAEKQIAAGDKFARWTVLDSTIETARGERKYLCRCECGTERYVLERSLLYGGSKSCGCLKFEKALEKNTHDLTGGVFGELTVLHRAEKQRKNGGVWWTCQCSCGNQYDVPGTLLMQGKRTHCPDKSHERNYVSSDITGRRFNRLVALWPTEKRDNKGSVLWHCQCDCGNTVDVSYNHLMYCDIKSCGCQKKEHDQKLQDILTRVAGTSIDHVKNPKTYTNNTTGYRGVYLIRGKWIGKIIFQQKAYYLGTYKNINEAVEARREAEEILFGGTAEYYAKWKLAAE